MPGVTYDTGALIAAERNDRCMWALHLGFLSFDIVPNVPAPVLAEAWRGGSRQSSLARLLAGCAVETLDDEQARRVGILAGRSRHDDIVDVTVVESALHRGDDVIVTSNESHVRKIIDAAGRRLRVEAI